MYGPDLTTAPDLESAADRARLRAQLADVHRRHLEVARQNAYRLELAYVRDQTKLRRTRFVSLSTYIVCICSAASAIGLLAYPRARQRWRAIVASHALLVVYLCFLGLCRDARFAEHSWTRVRFRGPRRTGAA